MVVWRSATASKMSQSFLFLYVICIPTKEKFPENVKSFGPYPRELEGQNCQK